MSQKRTRLIRAKAWHCHHNSVTAAFFEESCLDSDVDLRHAFEWYVNRLTSIEAWSWRRAPLCHTFVGSLRATESPYWARERLKAVSLCTLCTFTRNPLWFHFSLCSHIIERDAERHSVFMNWWPYVLFFHHFPWYFIYNTIIVYDHKKSGMCYSIQIGLWCSVLTPTGQLLTRQ
jgi:hypothetical protein